MLAQRFAEPLESVLAGGEYVVTVAAGFDRSEQLVEQLVAAMVEREASIAIASPFMRGGKLRDPSWLARTAISWENAFLSLAAHGELATVIGTVRVFRRDVLFRVLPRCPGIDLDSETVLEARRQGERIIEVPTALERKRDPSRFTLATLRAAMKRAIARLRTGLRYRPALWLALPGLLPGLLPLVIALLFIARATVAEAALWTGVTLAVQYGSLAIFSWQTSSFIAKRWRRRGST